MVRKGTTKAKFGRPRNRVTTGSVGSFLTGGFAGPAQPSPPAPKAPKPTKREKADTIIRELHKQGALSHKYFRGLKKR